MHTKRRLHQMQYLRIFISSHPRKRIWHMFDFWWILDLASLLVERSERV
jgi:hypothetical protein